MYTEGFCPVFVLDPTKSSFDLKMLDNAIVEISRTRDRITEVQGRERLKTLIIVDDAPSMMIDPVSMRNYFSSRSTSVLLVAAGRDNEWPLEWGDPRSGSTEHFTFRIDEQLSQNEKVRIVRHLYGLGYLSTPDSAWDNIIETEFESSFFATIYSLVYHARKPLTEILRDEYASLSGLTKSAFQYVCCFHQFNLPVNLELLVRTLECKYEDFYNGVLPQATGVIFEEQDSAGDLLYSTHHRIIAEKIVDIFFGSPKDQKKLFLDLLRKARLSNEKEKDIVEKLLIRHLGPRSSRSRFDNEDKREFFEAVCERNQIASLLHHYGILETDAGNFSKAEKLLKQALVARRNYPFASESDRNILTSLGRLYAKQGLKLLEGGDDSGANRAFAEAEETFTHARFAGTPNAYPYHAHATMYRERAAQTKDPIARIQLLGESLDILQSAEDNLNPSDLQPIFELKTVVYAELGDIDKVREVITVLGQKYNNAKGYSIYASLLYRKAAENADATHRRSILEEALATAVTGQQKFPSDEACARIGAKIVAELDPSNISRRFETLKAWHNLAGSRRPNLWLLFQLGVLSFVLDNYYDSEKYFRELDRISVGHKQRFQEHSLKDLVGISKRFEGRVSEIDTPYRGYIECSTARGSRFDVYFRPIRCPFTPQLRDLVSFNIAFTFLGAQAQDIRKR
jgi:tetratricopeptide (TPR) repeat protein